MHICRICLNQVFQNYHPMEEGVVSFKEKLLYCVPLMDVRMLKNDMGLCKPCARSLDLAFDFVTRARMSEMTLKAVMGPQKDFENLEKYALDASKRKIKVENEYLNLNEPVIQTSFAEPLQEDPLALTNIVNRDLSVITTVSDKTQFESVFLVKPNEEAAINVSDVGAQRKIDEINSCNNHKDDSVKNDNAKNDSVNDANSISKTLQWPAWPQKWQIDICHTCYRQFPNKTCLKNHLKAAHKNEVNFSEADSRRIKVGNLLNFLRPDEIRNINIEVAKTCSVVCCKECDIDLKCMHQLQYHIAKFHKKYFMADVDFPVCCKLCKVRFSHKFLEMHLKGHRMTIPLWDFMKHREPGTNKSISLMVLTIYSCEICDLWFSSAVEKREHSCKITKTATFRRILPKTN